MVIKMESGDYEGALGLLQTLDSLGDKLWSSQGRMLAGKIIREKILPDAPEEIKQELLKRAVKQFEISLELDPSPSNLATYWYLGDLQHELGNIDEAKVNLAFYLAMQPYAYDVRLRLAEIYLEEGTLDRARVLLEGMKTDPNEERRLKALALLRDVDRGKPAKIAVVISLVILILIVFIALIIVILKLKLRPKYGKRLG
jgi:tetratricopeptide (TPR) repeat protein